jgi:hypothetical protein
MNPRLNDFRKNSSFPKILLVSMPIYRFTYKSIVLPN